jgi:hypothetical protein
VVAVAAGKKIACEFRTDAALGIAHDRMLRIEALDADAGGFEHQLAARRDARIHEVFGDLRLAVDRDRIAGQPREVDAT